MGILPTWEAQLAKLEGVVDRLMAEWRPDGATEDEIQDMNKYALSTLASAYYCHAYTDASRPAFMPLWNYASRQGGPNPDYVYSTTQVDPDGTYQITGYRGTSRFVEVTQQAADFSRATLDPPKRPPLRETKDLDEFTIAADGSFSVILSAERPDGYDGDWWLLDPRARRLLMRKCACDWKNEADARVAISRLDDTGHDMTAAEFAARFADLPAWIEGRILHEIRLVRYYREHHGINVLTKSKWIQQVGGLAKQAYYDGVHEIDDDEALIVEVPLPSECRYWQILVADDRFATIDWVNRQSSLNDVQAHVDPDGKLRAVVSRQDPGVYNWLDKAGYPSGIIQMRLYQANEHPETVVTRVKVADVARHLPPGTRNASPAERQEQLRARREATQLRQIW
jgi:hypothetical protein